MERIFADAKLSEIYDRLWDIANQSATASLLEFNEDIAKKHKDDPSFKASDLYQINVQYYMDDFLEDDLEDETSAPAGASPLNFFS